MISKNLLNILTASNFYTFTLEGLKDIIKSWQEMCAEVSMKNYDYLNYRDCQFDDDLEVWKYIVFFGIAFMRLFTQCGFFSMQLY